MNFSNAEVANLLRQVATALTLKKANQYQVRAYENAADSIEHSTADLHDLWEEGKLNEISGIGDKLQAHLDELFKTGQVKHFNSIKSAYPEAVYELIKVPGVGPSKALELAESGVKSVADLKAKVESGGLEKKGFSDKAIDRLKMGVEEHAGLSDRMLLPVAGAMADKIVEYLKKSPKIKEAEVLGSLRRKVATIGDLDFGASSTDIEAALDWFVRMPGVREVVSRGDDRAMVVLSNGKHIDLLVGLPESWGALLQHFTGSKHHNIRVREYALKKGFSLNEIGVKNTKTNKVVHTKTEEELYRLIGMEPPPPEIREDTGEIEAAIAKKIPNLVEYGSIRGDFHLHSNFPIEPSHDAGAQSLAEIVDYAEKLGYEYVGLSDHSPAVSTHTAKQIAALVAKRTEEIKKIKSKKSIRVQNGLEIDIMPDGTLSVPDNVLLTLDYSIAGVHSVHQMPKDKMTKRVLKAIESPFVTIIAHPSGRLLNQRRSFEMEWDQIFKACIKYQTMLEVDAYPNRLDLRDDLVREAVKAGVTLIINSDAHEISQMDNMQYGVSVARRGWAESKNIANSWEWKKLSKWFKIKQ